MTAADGGVTSRTYDEAGRVASVTDPTSAVSTFDYDPGTGLIAALTDPASRVTSYVHDVYGNLVRSTFADASHRDTAYGELGRVDSTTDESGRRTAYTYDPDGNVISVEDPEGGVTAADYDDAGRVVSVTDPDDRETTYSYDHDTGLLSSETSAAGTVGYTYDDVGRPVSVTDLRAATTTTYYTPGGRVDHVAGPAGTTSYTYDDVGRQVSVTAPGGLVTTYGYDEDSRVVSVASPEGEVTATSYDAVGRVSTSTDPAGVVSTNTWTLRGQLASTTKTGEGTVEYSYNPDGTLDWVQDALNHRTTFSYDTRGRLVSRTDPNAKVWSTVYDAAGRLTSETDPLSRTTSYTYDDAGRPATAVDPSGRTRSYSWTPGGLLDRWSATDGTMTLAVDVGYDAAGRRTSATIGPRSWLVSYDAAGDVTSTSNPDGRVGLYGYDAAGRRTSMRVPDGTGYVYEYDSAGRIDTITPTDVVADTFTSPTGAVVDSSKWVDVSTSGGTISIDSNKARMDVANTSGALGGFRSTAPAASNGDSTFTYQFASASTGSKLRAYDRYLDANNNYRAEITANSTTATIIKVSGGTTTLLASFAVPSDTNAHRLRFQVNGTDVSAKVWNVGDPEPVSWTATVNDSSVTGEGRMRVQLVRSSGAANSMSVDDYSHTVPGSAVAAVVSYDFDDDGHLTGEGLAGSSTRNWTWSDGRLTGYSQSVPGANRSTTLTYDSSGRLATETTSGITTTYRYDNAGQLTSATPSTGTASSWTYDDLGRRSTQHVGSAATTYTYDDASELTAVTPSTGAATSYAYDGAGRRSTETTGTNVTGYTHDPAGRLTGITLPSGDVQTRTLNPNGSIDAVTNTVSTTTKTWTLDWDPTGRLDRLVSLSQGSATTDLVGVDEAPWAIASKGAERTVLASDAHGSVINSTGAVVPRANSYNAYGVATGADTLSPKLGYRGELTLGSLIDLRARDYQPATGAFNTVDPLAGLDGTPVLNNPYHYVNNNPLNLVDPSGLRPGDNNFGAWENFEKFIGTHQHEIILGIVGVTVGLLAAPLLPATMSAITAGALLGGLSTGLVTTIDQHTTSGRIDATIVARDTAIGAVLGAVGAGIGRVADNTLDRLATSRITTTPGTRQVLNNAEQLDAWTEHAAHPYTSVATEALATGTDEAVFWSGIRSGDSAAASWAAKNGGASFESTLAQRGISLPAWDASNPSVVSAWRTASADFAAGAKGTVRVLQEDAVRVNSVWAEVEFPALKANPNVTSILGVDPRTGAEVVLWSR